MALETPSTEMPRNGGNFMTLEVGGVTSTKKESELVDKCPSPLSSEGTNLRHSMQLLRVPSETEPQLPLVVTRSIAHPSLASPPFLAFSNSTLLLLG